MDHNFCIDMSVDYCESPVPKLRVIINDEELYHDGISTIFGATIHEGPNMKMFKKVGFCISIFFLLLTISIHLVVEEIRNELGGKMVIAISGTMVCQYICLFKRIVDDDDKVGNVSKNNQNCIALGKKQI